MQVSDFVRKYHYDDDSGVEFSFGKVTDEHGNAVLSFTEAGCEVRIPYDYTDDLMELLEALRGLED